MKAEIRRGRQKEGGLSRAKKAAVAPHERRGDANGPYQAVGRAPSWKQWHIPISIWQA